MSNEFNDEHMLTRVLGMIALQAMELREKIMMGEELPSWAEYKVYSASDSIKGALSSTYRIEDDFSQNMPMRIAMHKMAGEKDAPNYRPAEDDNETCETCAYRDESGLCHAFNFKCKANWVCDAWED